MLLVHHSNFGCMYIGYVFYLIYIQAVLQPDCEYVVYSIHNGVVGTLVPPFTTYYHTQKTLLVYRLLPLL